METLTTCSVCGAILSGGGDEPPAPCSRCFLRLALGRTESEDPDRVGAYRLIEPLGMGGMGEVYRARHRDSDHEVALKIIKSELALNPELVERFCTSAELAGKLEHPNIVRIYDQSGLSKERPYYTMQLVLGGHPGDSHRKQRFRDPPRAAHLMIRIARGIQFAHDHGVLHRDLKPDNILLDTNDEPYVADFNATRIDQRPARGSSSLIVAALGFMSPEQASGQAVTTATDVYGLGAIFYALLTGDPPLTAKTIDEVREQHASGTLTPPRQRVPGLNRELEAICLAALEKEPERRFRSAAQFAESLARVLRHEPPLWPPTPRHRRVALWARRHPLLAVSAVLGTLLLLVADLAMFAGARAQGEEVRDAALRSNAALASAQARTLLMTLEKYSEHAARGAADPAVQSLLARGVTHEPVPVLRDLYESAGSFGLDAIYVLDREGNLVARWSTVPSAFVGKNYAFRNYFKCARDLQRGRVCISPCFRSEVHNLLQFAFSAPVHDAAGAWLGALVMSKNAARTLKDVDLDDLNGTGQITAVFGARGAERTQPADGRKLIAVFHRAPRGNDERALDPELTTRLLKEFRLSTEGGTFTPVDARPLEDHDYRDPLSHPDERWLAALAPVGRTGYVVTVATPFDRALGPSQRLISLLSTYGGILNLSFLVIGAIAVWASLRGARLDEARASP